MPKTITDIIPPSRRRAMAGEAGAPLPPEPPRPYSDGGSSQRSRKFPYGIALAALVVVALSIGAVFAFSGAKVEVTPVVNATSVSGEFAATPGAGDLPYQVISVETTANQEVKAEGTETANIPAQGSITIYNAQEKSQELIKNTRFETPDGKIFRIRDSVTIPAGTPTNPGELKVTVYADAGGDSYNIGPSTFTLPGLKGGATFDLVYAKSTESMTGGFTGTRPSVAQGTRDAEYQKMQAALETELRTSVNEKIPEGFVLVPGGIFITYTPQPDGQAASDSVNLTQKASANAFIFPKEALARAIAYRTVGSYGGQTVTLETAEGLTLAPLDGQALIPGSASIAFSLSGNTKIHWVIDTAKIQGAVAGKSRQSAETILSGFPEVEKAVLVLRPFWSSTFPADPAKIEVKVEEPKG